MKFRSIEYLDMVQGDRTIRLGGHEVRTRPIGPPLIITPQNHRVNNQDIEEYRDLIKSIYGFANGCVLGVSRQSEVTSYPIQLYWYEIVEKKE